MTKIFSSHSPSPVASKPSASSHARGRPKAGTGTEISSSIMAAATAIFLAEGYEEASMEAIAARAGVTKPTLYKRFPDKRSLLQAVLRTRRVEWTAAPSPVADPEERLKGLASTILVRGVSPELRAFHALVRSAWPDPLDMADREEVLGYNDVFPRLEQAIRADGQALGVEPKRAPAVAAALMAMLSGWFEHRRPDPDRDAKDADEFARTAVELLIHGTAAW